MYLSCVGLFVDNFATYCYFPQYLHSYTTCITAACDVCQTMLSRVAEMKRFMLYRLTRQSDVPIYVHALELSKSEVVLISIRFQNTLRARYSPYYDI